jgi:2-amino-4-hydroxy-6-hydroxymethyldihydropteridine diphosphokinase
MKVGNSAFIAVGSNLGDRISYIRSAVDDLNRANEIEVFAMSDIIETAAAGNAAMGPFLNAALGVRTSYSPSELLQHCLDIESAHGRVRSPTERWHSRTLDLDLILYGSTIIDEPGLCVPHPRMSERAFVLIPLAQIAPNQVHPVFHTTIEKMLVRLQAAATVEYKVIAPGFEKGSKLN